MCVAAVCALLLLLHVSLSQKSFHRSSPHNAKYDFGLLTMRNPRLAPFVQPSKRPGGDVTIDFSDSGGVLELNRALLFTYYNVSEWYLDEKSLLPPIPSRADYVYHILDLLPAGPGGECVAGLDIGTGSTCIYPLIATGISRNIRMVGSEVNALSCDMARKNALQRGGAVEIRKQDDPGSIFTNVIQPNDFFHFSMCNPPFYKSMQDYLAASNRKNRNLNMPSDSSNFRGASHELYCDGGEVSFVRKMISESVLFKDQVGLFTTLISSNDHLPVISSFLDKLDVKVRYQYIPMSTGNKQSRFLAWTFMYM